MDAPSSEFQYRLNQRMHLWTVPFQIHIYKGTGGKIDLKSGIKHVAMKQVSLLLAMYIT